MSDEELYDPRLNDDEQKSTDLEDIIAELDEERQKRIKERTEELERALSEAGYSIEERVWSEEEKEWLDAPLVGAELDVFNEPYYTEEEWEQYEKWADSLKDPEK